MHFDKAGILHGDYKRPTFLKVLPTFGKLDIAFHVAAQRLAMPVNAAIEAATIVGEEIGAARNKAVEMVLNIPKEKRPEFLFFFGDDMLPAYDALLKLWDVMRKDPTWDIVAALYYVKQDYWPIPLLWRDEVPGFLEEGKHFQLGEVVPSDICGMDFTLIRPEIFEKIPPPWFKTGPTQTAEGGFWYHTEDAWAIRRLKDAWQWIDENDPQHSLSGLHSTVSEMKKVGGKVAVATGVRVGHLDVRTGEVY